MKEEATKYNKHTPIFLCLRLFVHLKIILKEKILFALPISIDQSLQIISNIRSFEKTNYEILIKAL